MCTLTPEADRTSSATSSPGVGGETEIKPNPMSPVWRLRQAPRCGARTRQGTACRQPAMKGKTRCLRHGGKSPGAPKGERNGSYRTGVHTQEMKALRRLLRAARRDLDEL